MISPRVNCTSTLPTAHEGKPAPLGAAPEPAAPVRQSAGH
jgi:hypothetical protein